MSRSIHLDRELLRAIHRGELPPTLLSQLGLKHLLEVCPHCRREFQAFQQEITGRVSSGNWTGVFQGVLKTHLAELKRLHRAAERDLEELLTLSKEERLEKVRRARRRFRGMHLAQLLLEHCEERFTSSPGEARHFAELARAIIQYSPMRGGAFDGLALATAHLANACRAGGNLREADEHFEHVHYLVNHYAVTDANILARIADFEGSLRKDQRRFAEAETLMRRALSLYRPGGSARDIARVLINIGDLFYMQVLPHKAMEATEEGLRCLRSEPDARLYLMGRHNLTLQLVEAGRPEQAAALLAADEQLYQQFPGPWTQLRLLWVRAKIAAGLGDLERAIEIFSEARQGFIRQGIGYDAAMVSLDLALLYLHQGRHAEIRELAEAMMVIFEAQDVHREAIAALMLFREAARVEAVTDVLLTELRAYFRTARRDAEYRFRPSGE